MIKKLLELTKKKKDFKTLQFYKFSLSMGAVEKLNENKIDKKLLLASVNEFLKQEKVLTHNMQQEYEILKDRYNRYLDYCLENRYIKKNQFEKIDTLNTISVPDMSKIKKPDISKELDELDIDLEEIVAIFSKIK